MHYNTMPISLAMNNNFGSETWSLTQREEHSLRVFDNRVLKKIFEPKREELMGD
jgi:hypothetical protein